MIIDGVRQCICVTTIECFEIYLIAVGSSHTPLPSLGSFTPDFLTSLTNKETLLIAQMAHSDQVLQLLSLQIALATVDSTWFC